MQDQFKRNIVVLVMKQGDVHGDGIEDHVYLYGNKPEGASGVFADQITLIIQDGYFKRISQVNLKDNAGYNANLFLGDFDKDHVNDVWIGIDSGGSGGYGIFYIYSFKDNQLRQLFDYEKFNEQYKFQVNYRDLYKVSVGSPEFDILFNIDISNKGADYLTQYYDDNGKLKYAAEGEVLSLGALYPIVTNAKNGSYDLLAFQRIIGAYNADTLGYVVNLLTWDGHAFLSSRMSVSILGTNL